MRYFLIGLCFFLTGCVGIPEGIDSVKNFQIDHYLGQWYEIARLNHSFEDGLEYVTATYSMRKGGGIKVVNRGFDVASQRWKEAEGKAYFVNDSNEGYLKVSFFGPFYASYVIFNLGKHYEYSLVTSSNRSYFWLLSRKPVINKKLEVDLINKIKALGFKAKDLIFVQQNK